MTESQPQQECPPPRTREAVDCWLRKWGRDAVVDGTEPLTRQDVERLIEANGGTAKRLNLRGRDMRCADLQDADLQGADLTGANLQGAHLNYADLRGVDLRWANLQGAYLWWAKLQGAGLQQANLQGATLSVANLQGADLRGIQISRETNLEDVIWPREYAFPSEEQGHFQDSQSTYRSLKTWHQEHGFYKIASEFNYREWVCRRKGNQRDFSNSLQKTRNPWRFLKSLFRAQWSRLAAALVLAFYEQLFGYGERPWRVVRAAVAVVLGLSLAYRYFGAFVEPVRFIDALYFSAVSFSALGYGTWTPEPLGWARYMGVAESFLGVFTIALFLVTFTRKMVR